MSIKSILHAYSGEAAKGSGLRYALHLAKHYDAWITGVLRHGQSNAEQSLRPHMPENFLAMFKESEDALQQEVAQRFQDIVSENGWAQKSEYVDLSAKDGIALSEYARSFDLVVTGVHSSNSREEHMSANPDLIALRSGRPTLVVPDGFAAEGLAENALVAWDGKRASARAIGDAMRTLEEKAKVTLLTVGSKEVPGTATLLRNLERHGINADLQVRPRKKSIGQTILSAAEDVSAKLVVMDNPKVWNDDRQPFVSRSRDRGWIYRHGVCDQCP